MKLEVVKLEVTKKVGKKVDSSGPDSNNPNPKVGKKVGFSSGPDSNKVNFELMLKVHQID